jgi:hypothetical protein
MRLVVAACICAALAPQSATPILRDRLVPATAAGAADRGALPLGFALAHVGVPMGIVTADNPSDPSVFASTVSAQPAVQLQEVVARFASAHPDHRIAWNDLVLSIERTDLACGHALDDIRLAPLTASGDMSRLLVIIAWLASGDPPPISGGSVSRVDGTLGLLPKLPYLDLTLPAGVTLRSAFDDVVRRNQGGVWIVWQHALADGSLGCRSAAYYSDGRTVGASLKDFKTIK